MVGLTVTAGATVVASGFCGANVTWSLDDAGTLTISGSGEMWGNSWYANRSSIKSVVISSGVTSISGHAFNNCTSLLSITIPSGVTSIGARAFSTCSALTSVTIPSTVTSIGMVAFDECTGLTSVTIEDGVQTIDNEAFRSCISLTTITIPASVTSMGYDVFLHCDALTTINFGGTAAQWAILAANADVPEGCKVLCSDNNFTNLQDLITGTADGGTLTLDKDYIALSTEGRISIPSSKTITIDLNGHTIDRNLSAAKGDGNVIKNSGNLIIKDTVGGGKITGGWTTGNGGGIYIVTAPSFLKAALSPETKQIS